MKSELRKAGKTCRHSWGGTSSASGGWRHAFEEEPTEATYPGLLCTGRRGRDQQCSVWVYACETSLQDYVCTFTGENIQLNVFIDLWSQVGLPGEHFASGTCVIRGWTSYPWKCYPELRLQSCLKCRTRRKAAFGFASFPPGIKYTYSMRSGRFRHWG